MTAHPMLVLISGPYMTGTDGDEAKIAANLARMEAMALPVFERGHLAVVAEWLRQSRIEFLVLSRPDDLTLDAMSREKAGISQHAVCFCISYGALDSE